jgi:hypothetical protein
MLGFLSPQYVDEDMEMHYGQIADHLFTALKESSSATTQFDDRPPHYPLNKRLELPARVALVLSLKCHLRERCAAAYRSQDHGQLYDLATGRLTQLMEAVDDLWQYHRRLWLSMYKPFGWEVLELRYGGLRTRLATMRYQIINYLEKQRDGHKADGDDDGDDDDYGSLAEFNVDLQCLFYGSKTNMLLDYNRVATPSRPG